MYFRNHWLSNKNLKIYRCVRYRAFPVLKSVLPSPPCHWDQRRPMLLLETCLQPCSCLSLKCGFYTQGYQRYERLSAKMKLYKKVELSLISFTHFFLHEVISQKHFWHLPVSFLCAVLGPFLFRHELKELTRLCKHAPELQPWKQDQKRQNTDQLGSRSSYKRSCN